MKRKIAVFAVFAVITALLVPDPFAIAGYAVAIAAGLAA
jgi:hypothetical protein